jgi:hypothetical protein
VQDETKTVHGQKTDRNGNRLDKDLSKGGGPFGNATSSLPDMWNRGIGAPLDPVQDSLRPIRSGPGRMYMVLAAYRLAALVSMIRKFEPKDTVNIVAHSQGCLLTLLAQAILMEKGERTADTLILTHPPYSLDEEMGIGMKLFSVFGGDSDKLMEDARHYDLIDGRQTVQARLQTLVNIVTGVVKSRRTEPAFETINECNSGGMVAGCWKPGGDRDNRGKVYLYFCPEDMTVALDNIRGIGWQGVPDYIQAMQLKRQVQATPLTRQIQSGYMASHASYAAPYSTVARKPLAELGPGFFQRVFTAKRRAKPGTRDAVPELVGQAPHDFPLRIAGEDDHAHVAATIRTLRDSLPLAQWPIDHTAAPEQQREGIRRITGEPLAKPCEAEMRGNQIDADKIPADSRMAKKLKGQDRGPCEEVDPITAAIAVTASDLQSKQEEVPDPSGRVSRPGMPQELLDIERRRIELAYNKAKNPDGTNPDNKYKILRAVRQPGGKVIAWVQESLNDARRRWQHELGEKSFHSAIFDSEKNHRYVTAYDLSIGSGKASSHRLFYAYLCAVADWRLKKPVPGDRIRPGILTWDIFMHLHRAYYECEPDWRTQAIEGNVNYYSYGTLPEWLPVLTGKLWDIVVSETTTGKRVSPSTPPKGQS